MKRCVTQPRTSATRGSASRRPLLEIAVDLEDTHLDEEREAAIRELYAVLASFRDGERNQTETILKKLIPRAKTKKRNILYGKWGGGRSMSESMNDKGKGLHPVLHKGYGDPKFKYKSIYPDPPGLQPGCSGSSSNLS